MTKVMWNGIEYPSQKKAAHIHGYSENDFSWFMSQGYASDEEVLSHRPKGHTFKRVCIITESSSEEAEQILSDMYYELVELHAWGLQVLIPDSKDNQLVFDIFNEPDGKFCVNCLIAHFGNSQRISGNVNKRSAYVDLSNPYGYTTKTWQGMVETVGRGKSVEFYPVGRTDTTKSRYGVARECVENCDLFVGLWQNGSVLRPLTQLANSLGKEVVLVDVE